MATHSNRMPVTQVGNRPPFKSYQIDNANAANCEIEELDIEGESGYQVRSKLSKVEQLRLLTLDDGTMAKNINKSNCATVFEGLKAQLETWPFFFRSKEESGIELQQGFVTLWSNFLIAETLMTSISIQPLVTMPNTTDGWKLKLYGYIWMISVTSDVWGITVTALFLGYLLGCPNKVAWNWMCEIGWMRSIPSILVLLDASLTLVAIACTCWILYGYQMGIVCAGLEVFIVGTVLKISALLDKASNKVTHKNMQRKVTTLENV